MIDTVCNFFYPKTNNNKGVQFVNKVFDIQYELPCKAHV